MITPRDYGLPHGKFRKYQLDSIKWCFGVPVDAFAAAEAETGSGKTFNYKPNYTFVK